MARAVLFIPTLTAGGAERVASVLANEWCSYPNVRVSIITLFDDPPFYQVHPSVDQICLGFRANKGGLSRLVDLILAMRALRRTVVSCRPDFVLSFMNKYNAFCVTALLGAGQSVIVAERDSPTEVLSRLRLVLRKLTYPIAAAVLVQSRASREFILSTTRSRRVEVLFNPVTQILSPSDRQPQKVILNVSRLHLKKGHADLLEAFAAVRLEGWSLLVCGDGPMRSALVKRAADLGISEQVRFLGTVADLRPHLKTAGIFAFPSYWEGFPNALAEAMLAGIPCVSYDCPTGPSELIEDEVNGLLVPVGDIARLKEALLRLMTDHELRANLGSRASSIEERVELRCLSQRYWDTCLRAATDRLG